MAGSDTFKRGSFPDEQHLQAGCRGQNLLKCQDNPTVNFDRFLVTH